MHIFGTGKPAAAVLDAPEPVKPTGRTRALVVGIDKYKCGSNLGCCVADAQLVADMLVARFGFEAGQVRMLTDERATRGAMLDRMEWLRADAAPGDELAGWHSGHGTQSATRNWAGEPDGLDEVLVPYDFDWDNEDTWVMDDDVNRIFGSLPEGVLCNLVFDTCHSEGLLRGNPAPPKGTPRFLEPPADIAWRIAAAKKAAIPLRRLVEPAAMNVGFVSACRSDETAAEDAALGHGALTYYLTQVLRERPDLPLDELVAAASIDIHAGGYSQHPQCAGARSGKPFLG